MRETIFCIGGAVAITAIVLTVYLIKSKFDFKHYYALDEEKRE